MTIKSDIPASQTVNGNEQVNFPAGAMRTHRIDVVDSLGSPQSMAGWSLAYVWRNAVDRLVLNKATGGGGVVIGNGTAANDRAVVTIDAADTDGFAGEYEAALWRTDTTNDDPLWVGTVVVTKVARQP